MQVQKASNQNRNLYFQGKGNLKKITSPIIKVSSEPDYINLTNKSNGINLKIQIFSEKEIKKLQEIAEKIYARKRQERKISNTK